MDGATCTASSFTQASQLPPHVPMLCVGVCTWPAVHAVQSREQLLREVQTTLGVLTAKLMPEMAAGAGAGG